MIHSFADGRIEDTGPLTRKRMETVDDEFLIAAKDFIGRQHRDGTPFFVWFNTTHMHFRTHAKPKSLGQSGRWQSEYHDVRRAGCRERSDELAAPSRVDATTGAVFRSCLGE